MLQTNDRRRMHYRYYVSSPQGNATNAFLTMIFSSLHAGFKSPRECYKRIFPTRHTYAVPHGFKSPRECYKPLHEKGFYDTLVIVSSPQGNATNRTAKFIIFLSFEKFQVPKGMLQTFFYQHITFIIIEFQVPKGMLQTNPRVAHKQQNICFKSPRECYKHLPNTAYLRCPTWFQVPKGMLQTGNFFCITFSIPRFQVPKGMLQTHF